MKSQALLAGVSGTAIGYVAGLSASPIASLLVAALLGVAAALLPKVRTSGSTSAVERPAVWSLSVAGFFVGVALGTTLGIAVRSTNFIADSPASAVKQWTDLGLDKATAVQRLFDAHYPKDKPLASERKGVLFSAADADMCVSLKTEAPERLAGAMLASNSELVRFIASLSTDPKKLKEGVALLCAPSR